MSEAIEPLASNGPSSPGVGETASPETGISDQPSSTTEPSDGFRPSFLFFGIVASVSLVLDVASKAWAALTLENRLEPVVVIDNHLTFTWALNRGGAWGILQNAGELVRKPFFFVVSILAIAFIVSLYSRLHPGQRALKWGLPLVLGGALGNLADRIVRGSVIDFIDYRGDWVLALNTWIKRYSESWSVTDHWPTFNVADISICVGVLLMAVDMVASRRRPKLKVTSDVVKLVSAPETGGAPAGALQPSSQESAPSAQSEPVSAGAEAASAGSVGPDNVGPDGIVAPESAASPTGH
ncbi:MAG: signal peptidase II, partial [Myxococcales bacterium]|nr:signal peptidase II [Myxococcales bacterium]